MPLPRHVPPTLPPDMGTPHSLRHTAASPRHTAVLADGRRLGYGDWGDPDGHPVLYFHGGFSSCRDIRFGAQEAAAHGVRIIAPDRPGIGDSDRRRGRTVAEWPADVEALADDLALGRFAVLGWSAGAPYALACAALLPDRVTHAATVGAAAPFQGRRDVKELGSRGDRALFPLARTVPPLASMAVCLTASLPTRVLRRQLLADIRSTSDRAAVAAFDWSAVRSAVRHGGGGTVDDYRAVASDWGFDPADITVPVTLWQGGDDDLVPIALARRLAILMPDAAYRPVPGAGHFLLDTRLGVVLDELLHPTA
jgi:pimeloyl-ACP methyl ester carboxylesterase